MKGRTPHILLVNPWIHDFAAYDFWAAPYGLLSIGALLRQHGLRVSYIDCLDRFHPKADTDHGPWRNGRGPYRKQAIEPPSGLAHIRRTYSRYGIEPEWFHQDLERLDRPDLVLVTSLMTYWYPGVIETIQSIRTVCPDVPIVLGGIYARLCPDHARSNSGANEVVTDDGQSIFNIVARYTGYEAGHGFATDCMDAWPVPAFDLQHRIAFIPLLTSSGCPYDCAYCASSFLHTQFSRRSPKRVVDEVGFWHRRHGVADFAFYDDALLVDAQKHARPIFEGIMAEKLPIRFHTPNAIHIRSITLELAHLMRRAGIVTLRLGLETTAFEQRTQMDRKVSETEFLMAVQWLQAAGYTRDQVGAYLLVGLPGQDMRVVEESIRMVHQAGVTPILAYYTPIPNTALWPEAVAASRYDLEADPIFSNNAIFPCQQEAFSWETLTRLKTLAKTAPECS